MLQIISSNRVMQLDWHVEKDSLGSYVVWEKRKYSFIQHVMYHPEIL